MSSGWISLHRKIWDNFLFPKNREFTKFEAWIDLLLMANHKEADVMIGNEVFKVKRGQMIRSYVQLSKRWKWSKSKVMRILKMFEEQSMIEINVIKKVTHLTVCNYESYQDSRNDDETMMKRLRNDDETMVDTNNNDNKENKVNNENKRPSLSEIIEYFTANKQSAKKASEMFEYYESLTGERMVYWRDKRNKSVKNWKNKARQVWFEDEVAEEHRQPTKEEIIEQCIEQLDAKTYIRQIEEKQKFKLDKRQLAKDYLHACEVRGKELNPYNFPGWISRNQLWIIETYKPKSSM